MIAWKSRMRPAPLFVASFDLSRLCLIVVGVLFVAVLGVKASHGAPKAGCIAAYNLAAACSDSNCNSITCDPTTDPSDCLREVNAKVAACVANCFAHERANCSNKSTKRASSAHGRLPIAGANPAAGAKSTARTRELDAQPAAQAPAAAPPAQPDAKETVAASSASQTSEQKPTPAPVPAAAPPAEKEAAPAQPPTAPDAPTAEAAPAPAAASAVSAPTGEKVSAAAPPPTAGIETAGRDPTASATAAATSAEQTAEKETALAPTPPAALPAGTAGEKAQASVDNDAASHANDKAKAELASLQPGFVPKDLVAALNDSVINFPSDSAEVPASAADFLQKAADDLKQLPAGQTVEIAAYTDDIGDAALNIGLSQRRADAVRQALIMFGADSDKLIAKGYGGAYPIASNETPDGRQRNLRIEYHIVKSP
jgi:outer membrane protein OmpA-like peptidoglycan-associated protein